MLDCGDPQPVQGTTRYEWVQCWASGELIPPISVDEVHPVSIVYDKNCAGDCDIKVTLPGYSGRPYNCTGAHFAAPNTVRVNPCPSHWPDHSLYSAYFGWWGYFVDDNPTKRIVAGINKAQEYGGDKARGVWLQGTSYGGTGVLMQSMVIEGVTVVHSNIGSTLFVADFPSTAALAWEGQDYDALDFRVNAKPDVFYRIHGSPVDNATRFNMGIFDVCNQQRLSCWGTWHDAGHNVWLNGMPTWYLNTFPGPHSTVQPDKPFVAFSNSTANDYGPIGHHNLGLEWNTAGMTDNVFPIRYRPKEGQPADVTFDITLRRVQLDGWLAWALGEQSGITLVEGGEFTITGLSLSGGEAYTGLQLTTIPGC